MVADTPTAAACSKVRLAGFGTKCVFARGRVLGEGARAPAEHVVTRSEPRHVLADRLDRPRDIRPRNPVLRLAQSGGQAHDEWRASHEDPVTDVDGRRTDADEDIAVADLGLLDVRGLRTSAGPYLS